MGGLKLFTESDSLCQGGPVPKSSHIHAILLLCLSCSPLLAACGEDNPYRRREPRCKVNCEGPKNSEDSFGIFTREGLDLPLDSGFWLEQTPLSPLNDTEMVQLALANPFVNVLPTDPSYSELGASLQSVFAILGSRAQLAANLTPEQIAENPIANCFSQVMTTPPSISGDSQAFSLTPGLCYGLDRVAEIVDPDQSAGIVAHVYEDNLQLRLPATQGSLTLSAQEPLSLLGLNEGSPGWGLPLVHEKANLIQALSLQVLQMQGLEIPNARDRFELSWDYMSLGLDAADTFSLIFDPLSESWTLNGRFVHASGSTQDPESLSLTKARAGSGYARVISFDNFEIESSVDLKDAFVRDSAGKLNGKFSVEVLQPRQNMRFIFEGTGRPCVVEVSLAGEDGGNLGKSDICAGQPTAARSLKAL